MTMVATGEAELLSALQQLADARAAREQEERKHAYANGGFVEPPLRPIRAETLAALFSADELNTISSASTASAATTAAASATTAAAAATTTTTTAAAAASATAAAFTPAASAASALDGVLAAASPRALPLLCGQYELLGELGRGHFGSVLLARDHGCASASASVSASVSASASASASAASALAAPAAGEPNECVARAFPLRALKVVPKPAGLPAKAAASLKREIDVMTSVRHPHIVALYDVLETAHAVVLVMEYANGGELFEKIQVQPYSERDAATAVRQMLKALAYLHARGIAHRDVKPENILLANGVPGRPLCVKLSDFGFAKVFETCQPTFTPVGTPAYVAPEVIRRTGHGKQVDMWSVGVLTYVMLVGYFPFFDESRPVMYEQILSASYEMRGRDWDAISDVAKDFVRKLLVVDPSSRMTAAEALTHPWIDAPLTPMQPLSSLVQLNLKRSLSRVSMSSSSASTSRSGASRPTAGADCAGAGVAACTPLSTAPSALSSLASALGAPIPTPTPTPTPTPLFASVASLADMSPTPAAMQSMGSMPVVPVPLVSVTPGVDVSMDDDAMVTSPPSSSIDVVSPE